MAERLHSAAIQLLRRVRVRDGEPGLSAARLSALSVIVVAGPITISELAATQGVRPPTMTRLVDTLARDGLAMREPHPDDGRSVQVRATARLIGECVEDPESRGAELQREPHDGPASWFASASPLFRNAATSASLPGFACSFTANPTRTVMALSSGKGSAILHATRATRNRHPGISA